MPLTAQKKPSPFPPIKAVLRVAILAASLPASASQSTSPVSELSFDLSPILSVQGVEPSAILTMRTALVAAEGAAWARGLEGDQRRPLRAGAVGIEPLATQGAAVDAGLSLKQTADAWQASRCRNGACLRLPGEGGPTTPFTVRVDGVDFRVTPYGSLCEDARANCRAFMPSWALSAMSARADGSMPAFPRVLLIVQLNERFLLVDAERQDLWFDLRLEEGSPARGLGLLERAQMTPKGTLLLTFAEGGMIVDFAADMLVLVRPGGAMAIKDGGLGKGLVGGFTTTDTGFAAGDCKAPRLLALGANIAVFSSGFTEFRINASRGIMLRSHHAADGGCWSHATLSGRDHQATIAAPRSGGVWLGAIESPAAGANNNLDIKDLGTLPWPPGADASSLHLLRGDLFSRGANGWLLLADGGPRPTSITGENLDDLALPQSGEVFVRRAQSLDPGQTGATSLSCVWLRFSEEATAGTFTENGGITRGCDDHIRFDEAPGGIAATSWQGSLARIALFSPRLPRITPAK